MARQGIGMGRTIWGEARMSATYFNKRGDGHSIRGTMAREQGAVAWSKLPATLRRGLSIRDAIDAEISREWHHAGKYATEVHVYYLDQVEEFWRVIDKAGVTVKQLKEVLRSRRDYTYRNTPETMALMTAVFEAADAAEVVRARIAY